MSNTKPRRGHKSYESAFNGVALYVQKHRMDLLKAPYESIDANQFTSRFGLLMRTFLKDNDLKVADNGRHSSADKNANTIQDNWDLFKKWLKSQENE